MTKKEPRGVKAGFPPRHTIGATIEDSIPWWPPQPGANESRPNVLIVLLDDVGFSDFGCYGSEIDTPNIDKVAKQGLRFTGFHTTAMCSTTRASLYTGHNHHAVGMGSLANFDSGFPGYRGKIDADTPTLAELLRPHGYRNYMVGKWHVTRLTETGPSGPFDGWPLGRGFDRFYGFLDAETDQFSPELVQDNSHIEAPGTYETGYHLTEDLIDHSLQFLQGHVAASPQQPWFAMLAPGACHAPHQAPRELIDKYAARFSVGWDVTREARLKRQLEMGIVPPGTALPPLNDRVKAWSEHTDEERQVFARLQGAYAAMLEHFDTEFGRLLAFLDDANLENTIIAIASDNGASQEGGPIGFINAMGPFNGISEPMDVKISRLNDIGGPDTHSNFPFGWAMAANTPLKRYKQNTHGGGIRDPLVLAAPRALPDPGGLRHNFCHVSDLAPTLLELLELPGEHTMSGTSFAQVVGDQSVRSEKSVQYFEMFGHRGIWSNGWKAVAFHPPGKPFDEDRWELYNLADDFSECNDLAATHPEKLASLQALWWREAEANHVLPLDDRFGPRFAENDERHRGDRTHYSFWPGMGHLPSDVAPDLRSRSYQITADIDVPDAGAEGVMVAHGDATSGYSLFVRDNRLVHDLNIGGHHHLVTSSRVLKPGRQRVAFRLVRSKGSGKFPIGNGTLLIDDEPVGHMETQNIFALMVSWSGLDVGYDRGTTVCDYDGSGRHLGPFPFTGNLIKVTVDLMDDQELDSDGVANVALSKE